MACVTWALDAINVQVQIRALQGQQRNGIRQVQARIHNMHVANASATS